MIENQQATIDKMADAVSEANRAREAAETKLAELDAPSPAERPTPPEPEPTPCLHEFRDTPNCAKCGWFPPTPTLDEYAASSLADIAPAAESSPERTPLGDNLRWNEFFEACDRCITRTHCAHHQQCLAECTPADLIPPPAPLPASPTPPSEPEKRREYLDRLHESTRTLTDRLTGIEGQNAPPPSEPTPRKTDAEISGSIAQELHQLLHDYLDLPDCGHVWNSCRARNMAFSIEPKLKTVESLRARLTEAETKTYAELLNEILSNPQRFSTLEAALRRRALERA